MIVADTAARADDGDTRFQLLRLALGIAWLLALTMAAISAANANPDEIYHAAAGSYYLTHWLPPQISEAALLPSISQYGFTYLGEIDATYFLAGKLASLLPATLLSEPFRFRAFNLLLFAILIVVYGVRRDPFSPFVLLLLSPQIWYVFSYFNNDGFPLFLSLLLVYTAFGSRSRVATALSEPWRASTLLPLVGTGLLAGLLALSKANYLPVVAFVVFFATWRGFGFAAATVGVATVGIYLARTHSFVSMPAPVLAACLMIGVASLFALMAVRSWRAPASRTLLARGAILAIAAVAIAAPPLAYDRILNGPGPEKAFALGTIAEKHAEPAFRPSESGDTDSFFGLRLRDKGLALHELLLPPWDWAIKSWKSFTGYYGYMKIRGPTAYYIAMFALYVALVSYTTRTILRNGDPAERQMLAVAALFCGGVIFLSFYHSWINDFQAQGRYLFPTLVLFAIPFARASRFFRSRVVPALLGMAFVLSASSFVFVGLRKIAKGFGP